MNNKEYISKLAEKTGYSLEDTRKLVQSVVDTMGKNFTEGDSVCIIKLGIFEVKKRLERIMVNPVSGQRMLVPPKLVLNFKPTMQMKDKIKKGDE